MSSIQYHFLSALALLGAALASSATQNDGVNTAGPSYSPARPPAVPLAVRSPYTSTWSTTANHGTLNSADVRFWNGDDLGWEGIVVVDGVLYEYLGAGFQRLPESPFLKPASPLAVAYDSQYSNFTFAAGPVRITASFFSPITPRDICRSSIPLSYLTATAAATDGRAHSIRFYSDVNAAWVAKDSGATIVWDLNRGPPQPGGSGSTNTSQFTWIAQRQSQIVFSENDDHAEWGNFTYTSSSAGAASLSFQSGFADIVRQGYISNQTLPNALDTNYRGWGTMEPVFAFAHDAGNVSFASVRYTVGMVQDPIIKYVSSMGISKLQPWWRRCYGGLFDLIDFHWHDFDAVQILANEFETQLKSDVDSYYAEKPMPVYRYNLSSVASTFTPSKTPVVQTVRGGEGYMYSPLDGHGFTKPDTLMGIPVSSVVEAQAYYSILSLSARQTLHAYVYAVPPASCSCGTGCDTTAAVDPLMFQKEISSDGNVNTVDVLYPCMPFFLWANPEMLRYTLQPLLDNQEAGFYPNGYCMHDLGSAFPNATGHVEGTDEYMPVEESGNLIIMALAYYRFSGNAAWLRRHYGLLRQFAAYLTEFSLVPAAQLSTDDFAGTLINQTNLAVKGIVGLAAMAAAAEVVGGDGGNNDSQAFAATASSYYEQWRGLGIDPSRRHALLAYQWRSSWGLLYNLFPDRLLKLNVFGSDVYDMQSDFYPTVNEAYGVPLDNRHHYTKSDWMMWAAAAASRAETRGLLVTSLARWLNETSTDGPFADLFEAIGDGGYPAVPNVIQFKARPVVGGHFALLAMAKAGVNPI